MFKGIKMNGPWTGRYLHRWNRNTLVARQLLTNDDSSAALRPPVPVNSLFPACPLLSVHLTLSLSILRGVHADKYILYVYILSPFCTPPLIFTREKRKCSFGGQTWSAWWMIK